MLKAPSVSLEDLEGDLAKRKGCYAVERVEGTPKEEDSNNRAVLYHVIAQC